jgi:hypothetical protein
MLEGNGVILPSSKNLIFPFKAANLKSVDLKIIRIFDNNLPYFLQENDLNGNNSVKRFGRPVYSGRVDLVSGSGMNQGGWNLYTIDLAGNISDHHTILHGKLEPALASGMAGQLEPLPGTLSEFGWEMLPARADQDLQELQPLLL